MWKKFLIFGIGVAAGVLSQSKKAKELSEAIKEKVSDMCKNKECCSCSNNNSAETAE